MFGHRTPAKKSGGEGPPETATAKQSPETEKARLDSTFSKVRRSIGEWEAASNDPTPVLQIMTKQAGPAVQTQVTHVKTMEQSPKKYANRTAEAKAFLLKAKNHLSASRNLKTDIKNGITEAIEKLYDLVKEAEKERQKKGDPRVNVKTTPKVAAANDVVSTTDPGSSLRQQLQEHTALLLENNVRMDKLKGMLEKQIQAKEGDSLQELKDLVNKQTATIERVSHPSFASITANQAGKTTQHNTLHSVVISSRDEDETGEEILERVRKAADAKDGWITVERVRKAKDRKVIMGFSSKEEREKMKSRLQREKSHLSVEDVKNKNPLLILKDLLAINTDEDVITGFRNQNWEVFHGLSPEEDHLEVKYRRRARNPHTEHVIVAVSPQIWKRTVERGYLHIDLQRIRVEDQSPLVQCTRCLGFGHGKRFCKETADRCSHCAGPHLRADCMERKAGESPECHNCTLAKHDEVDHDSFSVNCPVRKKWDRLARSAVAYC